MCICSMPDAAVAPPAGIGPARPGQPWPLSRQCKTGARACRCCCGRGSAQFIAAASPRHHRNMSYASARSFARLGRPVHHRTGDGRNARRRHPADGQEQLESFRVEVAAAGARRPIPWPPTACATPAASTSIPATPGRASVAWTRRPRYTRFCTRSSLAGSSNTTRSPLPSARGSA